jgi:hypothetical protein
LISPDGAKRRKSSPDSFPRSDALQQGGDLRRVRKLLEQERQLGLEPADLVLEGAQVPGDRLLLPDLALQARQLGLHRADPLRRLLVIQVVVPRDDEAAEQDGKQDLLPGRHLRKIAKF